MSKPASVSVLIPVLNESSNIEECLKSVHWSDDVVVVDSGSIDQTQEKARNVGARVVEFTYTPGGLKKKNWALENVSFKHAWILILDADERITPELAAEIREVTSSDAGHSGYYINRRFMFMGRWIRHSGYYPSWNLRLFQHGRARYEFIPDCGTDTGDNEVHEHMLLDGSAGFLKKPMDHFAFPDIRTFVEKHNRYSNWEARVGREYLARAGPIAPHLRTRRLLKRAARSLPFAHRLRFLYHYILRLGVLDGREGYVLCRLLAEYEFLIWAKSIEARIAERNLRDTAPARTHRAPRSSNTHES